MNLLLLQHNDFINTTDVKIQGRRFEHLTKIIKVKKLQSIDAGIINGKIGKGKILDISADSIIIATELNQNPPAPSPVTLILALPRPLMLKRILQTVTTMGIKNIHLINCQRVEKSYWRSSDMAENIIQQQFILGLEQARDTVLPTLFLHKHFHHFVTNELPLLIKKKQAFLAHPGNYPPCPGNLHDELALAIGPEGGFIPDEVYAFTQAGFQPVQLGERPLRVETAVTALLGRLLKI